MWQIRYKATYEESAPINFNNTITSPVTGLGSPLFKQRTALINDIIEPAPPVGVRCRFYSEAGTAALDPADSSFHSFVPVPAVPNNGTASLYRANPFGTEVSNLVVSLVPDGEIYDQLFKSTNSPSLESYSNNSRYTYFLQAHKVLEAIIRAFIVEALQLMYDGFQNLDGAYEHEALKASNPGKILGPGSVPSIIPIVLFCIWALGCLVLDVTYGFRRRWAKTLDG
ncbi:hypothetical protein ACJ73_02252 [Blastomyces percursus]|uniref:Uncharacterized protein n=1 Tax=Blastomyces percursus TaxID=1658174 RepID=A0A1J9RCT8_9EURO|nr:hypothetical protein ACJ73_02252 [Blastomyces percursus]